MGAKSSSVFVETKDTSILIDPGVSVMHPGFPASDENKKMWWKMGMERVKSALSRAKVVIITHYHYDHYTKDVKLYDGKVLLVKNPNSFINLSQRKRAFSLLDSIFKELLGGSMDVYLEGSKEVQKDTRTRLSWKTVPEVDSKKIRIFYGDGRIFQFGGTVVRFSRPFFHGVENSRLGWVVSVIVEEGGKKLLYSSDLNGPIVEEYADFIIEENPDVLILDGPPTYLLGYMMSKKNLKRAVSNAERIVEKTRASLIIYDHHLVREPRFRERTKSVWERGKSVGKLVVTASEYFGERPKVEVGSVR